VGAVAFRPLTPIVGRAGDVSIADAIGDLVRARSSATRTEIALPVLYPNGSHVVVTVYPDGDAFTVTDEGGAAAEAEMAGVHLSTFSRIARHEAARVGAVCDSRAFFFLRVSVDRLTPAITILADLARGAVAAALEKLAERSPTRLEARLIDHLEHTFGGPNVHPRVEIAGASNVEHRVNALVTLGDRRVVFDMFTDHGNSFNAAVSKFLDISHREDAPARVGVTLNRERLGDRLSLIGSVAKVIDLDAMDEVYRRAAA
jgi:hypothetical protein